MSWYGLYRNNHYSGGMDFDYFAAVVCNDSFLVKKLEELVDLYAQSNANICLTSFSKRLIESVLTYFLEHKWSTEVNKVFLLSDGFLSSCQKLDSIPENKKIIYLAEDLKSYLLSGAPIVETSIFNISSENFIDSISQNGNLLIKSLKFFREYIEDKNVRNRLCDMRSFLIYCAHMPDTLKNQEIRRCAKYLLINFIDGYIARDIIRDVRAIVLER